MMIMLADLPGLLSPVITQAEAAGLRIASEFKPPRRPGNHKLPERELRPSVVFR